MKRKMNSLILKSFLGGAMGAFTVCLVFAVVFYQGDEQPDREAGSHERPQAAMKVGYSPPGDKMSSAHPSFADAAKEATPVVVHIRAEESRDRAERRRNQRRSPFSFEDFFGRGLTPFYRREGSGSGVIFSEDGYIVTNHHVVEFADIIEVTLADGRTFEGRKVGAEPSADIAVIKIEENNLPTIDWANSENAKVGDWVLAIGNPFDYLTSTVTAGIISAKGRDLEVAVREGQQSFRNFIQTDAAVNPGNSGGALVNVEGELLGINSAIATPTGVFAGYSFAIPVESVRSIVEAILEKASNQSLGIEITAMDEELAEYLGVDQTEGVLIVSTEQGSAAQFAGLQPLDIILTINGEKVRSIEDLERVIQELSDGAVLGLELLRKGKKESVQIQVK